MALYIPPFAVPPFASRASPIIKTLRPASVSIQTVSRWLLFLAAVYVLASVTALVLSESLQTLVAMVSAGVFLYFFPIIFLAFGLRLIRWHYLLRTTGIDIPWQSAAAVYLGGFPMALTPGRIGELWRAWVLTTKWNVGYRRGLPPVLCDRLLDLNVLFVFAALGVFGSLVTQLPAVIVLALFLPLFVLLFKPAWTIGLIKQIWGAIGKPWPRRFAALINVCRHIGRMVRPAVYLPALLLSFLAWGAEAFAIFLVAIKIGGALTPMTAMTTLALSNIVGVLSFLPGGIGGQEATMIYLLQNNGNTLAAAVAITGIARFGTILLAVLLGFPFFVKLSRRKGN